jgi:2-polyprenyl-3-methyl-5-hydroxy-6-metoxy-1,4-benzoquinol methylase
MDQPGLDALQHAAALSGLRRINRVSRSDAILWPGIAGLAKAAAGASISVLDLACGGGDVAIALKLRADRAGLGVHVDGCDKSREAVRYAQHKAKEQGIKVRFFALDVVKDAIPAGYDVVTCCLFLHHLDQAQALGLLAKMAESSGRLVLVNDLIRSRTGYALAWAGCRMLSNSPIVRHDGPVSVAAAFTLAEVRELAGNAGMTGAKLTRHWPCRFLLSWSSDNPHPRRG